MYRPRTTKKTLLKCLALLHGKDQNLCGPDPGGVLSILTHTRVMAASKEVFDDICWF